MASGVARTPWLLLIPLAHPGTSGLAIIVAADSGLLLAAGVFNPCFVSHRMAGTDDAFMARVGTAWSISSKAVQPVFIAAGGYLATVIDLRHVILLGALLCAASTALLPWGTREPSDAVPAPAAVPAHT